MGYHYIPQRYLQGFVGSPTVKALWQFDKKNFSFSDSRASISKIAQQRLFYDPESERLLNELVERPANQVLHNLRNDHYVLYDNDRMFLSIYMATMLKRVPYHRSKIQSQIPEVLKKATSDVRKDIRQRQATGSFSAEQARQYLQESEMVENKYAEELPSEVRMEIFAPWPSEGVIEAIYNMDWRFVIAEGDEYFVTSDNPVFFFESYGLGTSGSEITFPVSNKIVLFGSRIPILDNNIFTKNTKQFVREANRRLIFHAERFIYSTERSGWIKTIAEKNHIHLNTIKW